MNRDAGTYEKSGDPNENVSGYMYTGVRLAWTGENQNGIWNGKPADQVEIDGVRYPMPPLRAKAARVICRMPEDHAIWPNMYAIATPDGESVQFCQKIEQAFNGPWDAPKNTTFIVVG